MVYHHYSYSKKHRQVENEHTHRQTNQRHLGQQILELPDLAVQLGLPDATAPRLRLLAMPSLFVQLQIQPPYLQHALHQLLPIRQQQGLANEHTVTTSVAVQAATGPSRDR